MATRGLQPGGNRCRLGIVAVRPAGRSPREEAHRGGVRRLASPLEVIGRQGCARAVPMSDMPTFAEALPGFIAFGVGLVAFAGVMLLTRFR